MPERDSAERLIAWAVETYRSRLVLSCSFGGPTGMVILDMLARIDASVPVAYLDTGLLFPETYALLGIVERRYGIAPIAIRAALSLDTQAQAHGDALWEHDPRACCALRKVEPQRAFLRDYDAWITGIRRDQAATRREIHEVERDKKFGLTKINPLAGWSERAVWRYIAEHDVPYNPLLKRGYASIGCVPCTRPIEVGEDARAGRWSGFGKTECGLHVTEGTVGT